MKIGGDYMRLIDADALDWERIEHEHGARHEAVVDCEQMVETAPTIDPVRHGRWEDEFKEDAEAFVKHRYVCTACSNWQTYGKTAYCTNCGAKMDR